MELTCVSDVCVPDMCEVAWHSDVYYLLGLLYSLLGLLCVTCVGSDVTDGGGLLDTSRSLLTLFGLFWHY
jgi:hypothetical protein